MRSKVSSIRIADLLPLAWSALRRNRLRSTLTIGAIAVGVAVLVYLVSLGLGLERLTVGNVLKSSTLLSFTVSSFNKEIKPLDPEALAKISSLPDVSKVLPKLSLKAETSLSGEKKSGVTVIGVDPEYFSANDRYPIKAGRPFGAGETNAMLVTRSFLKLYGFDQDKAPLINFDLQLDGEYGQIGIIKDVVVRGVVDDDSAIAAFMPRDYLESLLKDQQPNYDDMLVVVANLNNIESATNAVIAEGYKVTTVVDTVDEIKRVFGYIQITMIILGLIALVVASIGMFNTLTVSLLERTREIGIMKALGIKRGDVRRLFLAEAFLIGILGGVVGLVVSFILQQVTLFIFQLLATIAKGNVPDIFQNTVEWSVQGVGIPIYWPISALLFSLLVAGLTGIYPASRAAKLNPIDAIRHE